ncbi:MAG: hypothetical protein HY904_14440, partial [Deltaproteobacteria bacterium]|nr:hypothetical protein [Deltaproteobacteria bacterium]
MNRRSVLNVLGALAVLAGCTRVEGETAVTVPQPVQHEALTTDPTLGRFVLLAEDRVETGPRSVVRGGDVGSRGGADGWSVVIGNRGRVEGGNILAASVKLRHGAVVEDVQTERFSGGDATHGLVMPLVVTVPELPAASAVTPGHADVRVRPRTSRTLEAGRFDSVEVSSRGTLRLTGGVYELRTLEVGANARIEASAPSELRVLGRVRMGRGATVGANSGVARDLRIESGAGTAERDRGDDNEEREEDDDHACGSPVEIQAEARVTALLLAPRARVHVGSEVVLVGAIAGRSIHLGPRAEASFQGGLGGGCSAQSCDDGNACNGVETCEASGVCTAGVPPVVDDGNRCTVDACDPATGVTHVASAAGTACGDGNACNGDETCDGVGACAGGTAPPVNDGNPCTVDGCDPATGVTHVASAAGTACGDGNACNGDETCDGAGACAAGTAPVVDDGNPCTVDGCDPAMGVTHMASAAGTACADGNACNGDEACDGAGTCTAGTAPPVDDGNRCTVDGCDPASGVTHVASAAGTACGDGNACNGDEACDGAGACAGGTAPPVDDGNPCTVDGCDPATGVTHVASAAGTACGDGNTCNGDETCDGAGTCAAGMPPALDDGNPCTVDACEPGTGVTHVTLPPTDGCWLSVDNDGDAFTENGGDCNDADAAIHPGATEACGNGVDEDCSGADLACGGIPTLVAPPLDPSVTTTMLAATAFLYTGPGAVQTGVAPGTITAERVAVLRGLVMTRDGVALPGVRITVRDHTEFGSTLSRLDGWFDLAVNGGGLLMLQYRMEGYVEVERRLEVPWRDYLVVPEVAMVALDPVVTQIDFSTLMEVAVARGSVSSDADGERQATLLFAPGSTAELVFTDDTTVPISQVTLRQTEVTVGPNGQRAMPADLPTNSAYTYAVDLRVEEAVAAGAAQLRVSPPVSFYVENFLNFPVGGHVPAAWYRPEGMAWIGAEDALVIKVLSVTDGAADLDVTGSGTPSDEATLGGLGITAAERVKLAELYVPNATVWRTRLQHFSLWDLNGSNPWDVPQDPAPVVPPLPSPRETEPAPMDDNCEEPAHSTVDIQNQLVKERLPLVGTPHTLHYRSDRVPGRQDGHVLKIPLTGPEPPMRLVGVKVEVSVAGNREYLEFETLQPNMIHTYHWSGLDAYGRKPQGSQPVSVNIGYVYRMTYRIPMICCPSSVGLLCGQGGACCISWEDACMASGYLFSVETRDVDETAWTTTRGELSGPLGVWDVKAVGLGGWSLDSHHTYDPGSKRLFLGTGRTRSAEELPRALRVMSDDGQIGVGDEPAAQSLGIMADGAALVARSQTHEVVRLSQDGEVTRIAGTGEFGDDGDGGPAVEARLRYPVAAVVAVDGSILIADAGARKVRRVGVDGVISTVFMDSEFQGAMAAVPDGSIVFGASVWLKRWLPDGRVVTAAGNGTWGTSGDNGPAGQAALTTVEHVAVGPDGTVYLTSSQPAYLRKVIPGGTISRVAGNGTDAFAGDGVQGPDTGLGQVHALTVGPNGSVYVAATVWGGAARVLILEVTPDGRVRRVAGRGPYAWRVPAVGAALNTPLGWQSGLAVAPDGMLWILENGGNRLRRVEPALPSVAVGDIVIPSENGGEVYVFDLTGRHLRTLDGSTNAVVRTFTYEGGQLAGVTDADGGTTEIERDGAGNATGIVSAKGQRTMLQVDGNGDLVAVTDPAGNAVQMSYYPGGLLEQFTNARGFASYYGYDELGRLTSDSDTVGGYVALARTEGVGQAVVTKRLAEGAAATYGFGRGVSGGSSRTVTNTFADGTQVTSTRDDSGVVRVTRADGTQLETASGPDPRFGMLAPITVSRTRRTPAGKVQTQTVTRTATLANPDDPLSLVAEHEERTVNGRVSTRDYDAVTRTTVTRSPEGRTQRWVTDEKGRVTEHEAGGLVPARMSYDAEGRLMGVASGLRTTTLEYDSLGRLAVVTDPAGQTVGLAYDDANRVTEQTLADGNTVRLRYDA